MMNVIFFVLFFYMFSFFSFHSLLMLMLVELATLFSFFYFLTYSSSWILSIMFLFCSVCVGAYGICLFVSVFRNKGNSYLFSFKSFF